MLPSCADARPAASSGAVPAAMASKQFMDLPWGNAEAGLYCAMRPRSVRGRTHRDFCRTIQCGPTGSSTPH
jgi:hypothetical protein